MKFSYKEKQDLIWSLEKNAELLTYYARSMLDLETMLLPLDNTAGVKDARDNYSEAMKSHDRLLSLALRIEEEA